MAKTIKSKLTGALTENHVVNYVAIVLDESGSMDSIKSKTLEFLNKKLLQLKNESFKHNQTTYLTFVKFANRAKVVFSNVDINDVILFTNNDFIPYGYTALFSAVDVSIEKLQNSRLHSNKDNVAYLVITITDGNENASSQLNIKNVMNNMNVLQKTDSWTFAFCLPPNCKNDFVNKYNIPPGNCIEWENSDRGVDEMDVATTSAISNYHSGRSLGVRSTKNFFADMSHVTTKDLKKLTDVSHLYKSYKVDGDYKIQDFVQFKTKKPYVPGSTYYELTKKETVQSNKDILIVDKNNEKIVYGGREARDLLGIPHNEDVKLEPWNIGHYKIFVLSTSVNRNLVRGTKVFVRR